MSKILLLLIFLRPFISSLGFPYTNFIYSLILLIFISIWIIDKGILWDKIQPIKYPLILFVVSLFISILFSQNKIASLKEIYKYITALLLFLTVVTLSDKNKKRLIACILTAAVLISFYAIYQYFFGFRNFSEYVIKQNISSPFVLNSISQKRVFFPFVTPNTLAGYLVMIIPLALFLMSKHTPWFLIPLFIALLFTKSIGGLISILLGLFIYFYLKNKTSIPLPGRGKRKGRNSYFFLHDKEQLIFLLGLLITTGLIIITRTITQKQYLQPAFSTIMRIHYWQDTLKIISAYPLSGVGIGNFNLFNSRYAHNSYLQICAEMGIIGLISFLWLTGSIIKINLSTIRTSACKNQIIALLTANIVFLIHNFGDFTFFLPEVSFIWWIILGLSLSIY